MKKEIIVYSISDSLGGTSQKLLSAVSAQYPDIIFNNSYRFPFINQEEELLDILCDAMKDDALVISTLVNSQLSAVAREFSQKQGLSYLDLMHPFFEIIQEKTAKIQSIWWLSPAKEKCNVRWNCSAPIMGKTDHSSSYIINPDYNMNSSQITIDLTDVTDNFTVEAIVSIGNLSIRRFQTIPIVTNEIRCDAFYYTFGTPLMQLENNIDNENTLNSDILKATYYARTRPVNFLGFTNLPGQRLEKLYCTATIADPNPLHDLQYACKICLSPEEPEFELQSGSENVYRVLNPQQWEINGLLCTLENTTWQQLGASENTDDTEFACLTIKKL